MSIRVRLVLTISACLILAFGGISFLVFSSAKQTADKSFHALALNQAERVEEWINTFLSPGAMSVRYLADLRLVRDSRGKLTSDLRATEATTLHYANQSDHAQRIYDEFIRVVSSHDDYDLVFMANDDGQYVQAPEGPLKQAGYDSRTRSWYKEAMQSDKDLIVSAPYLTNGGVACSVMVKTRDLQGKPLGMLGVDYNLNRLTDDLTTRRILKTGYLVVFAPDGRIVVDGRHPERMFASPEDYPPIRKLMAAAPSGILNNAETPDLDEFIVIRTMDKVGWKIAVVFQQSEMLESSYALLSTILLIVGFMFAVTLSVLFMLARSIAHPIEKLIEASVIISSGAYENSDEARAELQTALAVKSQGESKKLAEALETMIRTLHSRIEAANVASRAKSAFLSTMSHEIRTPMNAILGITEIQLQNNALDQSVRDALEKIYASGDMLLGIINNILDLSKIEAGKLELVIAKYETASLLSDIALLNMMRIGSKPIEFELHVDENLPLLLSGDELRVKQIFNNLLSNAFKYTEKGTVCLSVAAATGGADDETTLVFSVRDTGQGMTEEQVAKLFDEYSRFNQEANRTTEGTGLGMSITRDLIRMMHGEISIESEPGRGSTFTVRLPQGKINADILGKAVTENLHKFRTSVRAQTKRAQLTRDPMPYGSVLIVDDVETNILVAEGLISLYGIKIESADSGPGAIEKIKNGSVYDIVFMDHMMPKMDGIEATSIIRSMGYERPIVALTANAVVGQADIFLKNGFDDFISKPLDIRLLDAVLNKLIRDKQPPEVLEAARRQAAGKTEQECLPGNS